MKAWRDKVAQLLPPLRGNPAPSVEGWQREKFGTVAELKAYEARYCDALGERLREAGRVRPGTRVLCLGTRLGSEVRVFQELGCFAVGIATPGGGNYVLAGDVHDLQFPDGSVDVVFTNSFDRALEPEKVLREIRRVLRPGGLFIADAIAGRQEGDDLAAVGAHGFELLDARDFGDPWSGRHLTFKSAPDH